MSLSITRPACGLKHSFAKLQWPHTSRKAELFDPDGRPLDYEPDFKRPNGSIHLTKSEYIHLRHASASSLVMPSECAARFLRSTSLEAFPPRLVQLLPGYTPLLDLVLPLRSVT